MDGSTSSAALVVRAPRPARAATPRSSARVASFLALSGCVALAACGGGSDDIGLGAGEASISMTVVNQVQLTQPCMGASLTFFEGTAGNVDIGYQEQKTVQVSPLFGVYEIGFQVNGWYWRTCTSPGDCPNPKGCQNPDNAGQVGIQIAADCSSATLLQNWTEFTCDAMVPNASQAVSVTLQSQSPCTVMVSSTSTPLQPTDQCCSCMSCTASETPAGQMTHCQ